MAGFLAFVVLGGVWFAVLFPRACNRSLGRAADAKPLGTLLFYAGPPLTALVVTVTSAILMAALHIDTYGDALLFGLIVGLGYLTANTINPNFPRPILYGVISGGYNLLGSLIVSTLLLAV
ncbi:MAG TPA: DUF1761 domain-containing protein [Actinoplanes sp.]|nr:DUF1761 domain-containing protein [Actinoplanes sp.]